MTKKLRTYHICSHSVQNILPKTYIKMDKIINLNFLLRDFQPWSVTPKKERELWIYENKVGRG
jgi:hypothetical protein